MSTKKNIILIDDTASSNMYHKIMIEEAGLDLEKVTDFTNSDEALRYLQELYQTDETEKYPDVILIDINMPMKNGWECIDTIMEWGLGDKNPLIYMVSNSRHPVDLKKAEEHPLVEGILEKFVDEQFFRAL